MKLLIGSIFKRFSKPGLALEIPGIGILESIKDEDDKNSMFDVIILNKKQLIKLRNEIDKEINYENNMERSS